jgi:hypothetical protein
MLNKSLPEAIATEFCCFASFNVKRHLDTKSVTLNLLKSSSRVKNAGSLFGGITEFFVQDHDKEH